MTERSASDSGALSAALMARVEDAGINASAPREQLLIDGWLVRLSPGKAKRARCIQAVGAGTLPIDDKLRRCRALFEAAGLPLFVRITPFAQPHGLDAHLADLGMDRIDDSRVMIATVLSKGDETQGDDTTSSRSSLPAGWRIEPIGSVAFAAWIGQARGSTQQERDAHAARIAQAPLPHRAFVVVDPEGKHVAGGQLVLEDDLAGLYDVFTDPSVRKRGLARVLCRHLLSEAAPAGARVGYLQVDAANTAALSIYRSLGFVEAYAYHYRTPSADSVR